jgi:hypothetical protein
MNVFQTIIYFLLLIFYTIPVNGQEYKDFNLEESRKFQTEFADRKFTDGGEMSRYLYLHFSEFYPHTVIN